MIELVSGFLEYASVRVDIAFYLDKLIWIYTILIFIKIILSWVPKIPYNRSLYAILQFINDVTEPYLRIFRRLLPPVGERFRMDLSPLIAIFVLILARSFLIPVIAGG